MRFLPRHNLGFDGLAGFDLRAAADHHQIVFFQSGQHFQFGWRFQAEGDGSFFDLAVRADQKDGRDRLPRDRFEL